ncbi:SR-related and CTD-associated factor 4 isoform X2 [Hyalella azteca]|uniref:SR-related and CTD-associated factor 4 isoform X2 n=1 Tax=Hyalella azteca TaxID=294128 RepID=A0A8B7P9H4_HYAAZ|nr:SR-related and CTD-associated factor 4 isoform X2 [Hyalella azteca]
MDTIKSFNMELAGMYECKPPISKAKMTAITKRAIRAIKFYKHVVQSVEKFIQKCKTEYKIPGLYVIDSIVRQSRHQFGADKDVFAPRFAKNILVTFYYLFKCPAEGKSKVIRVLNLWQKNHIFGEDVIQPLFDLADPNHPIQEEITQRINQKPSRPRSTQQQQELEQYKQQEHERQQQQQHTTGPQSPPSQPAPAPAPSIPEHTSINSNNLPASSAAAVAAVNSAAVAAVTSLDPALIAQIQQILMKQQPTQPQQQQQPEIPGLGGISEPPSHTPQQQQQQQALKGLQSSGSVGGGVPHSSAAEEHVSSGLVPVINQTGDYDGRTLPPFLGVDISQPPPGYIPPSSLFGLPPPVGVPPPQLEPGFQGPPGPLHGGAPPQPHADVAPVPQFGQMSPREEGEHSGDDSTEEVKDGTEEWSTESHHRHHHHHRSSRSPSSRSKHRRRRSRSRSRSKRSRSGSRSRSRKSPSRSSRRKRSRSRDRRERDRERERSSSEREKLDPERERERELERERERERKKRGLPPIKPNHLAVCSTTLWVGHLSKLVHQEELSDIYGEYGDIVSIDLIPPRGCAFICMNRRQDASRALTKLRNHKIHNKAITMAWAPGKGVKGKEFKDYWEVEAGCSYIPYSKLTSMSTSDLDSLEEGGVIDEETVPDWLKGRYGVSEAAPGGGPLPGFLPIGVPAGAPPSGVNAPVIPVSGAPPVSGMHVVDGGRDMPGREGPPPSLGPTGPRMPHNVIPPFGLPSLPPPGVGPRGLPPMMPPNMPPNMPPSLPPNMPALPHNLPPNLPPNMPPNMPPSLPRLGVPHSMGLGPPLAMPPVSSMIGQPIMGALPPPVSMASLSRRPMHAPPSPDRASNSRDSDSMDVEMEDVAKDIGKEKELDENGLNDDRDGDSGDGKMSITQMYNKYIAEEENKMNGAEHFPGFPRGHPYPGSRPPHFYDRNGAEFGGPRGLNNGPSLGLSNGPPGPRLHGAMAPGLRPENFVGVNVMAAASGPGFGPRAMFGAPRPMLAPPPMGVGVMGPRPTLLHDLGPHRPLGPALPPMQRLPEGLTPQMMPGIRLMGAQSALLFAGLSGWREGPPPMFAPSQDRAPPSAPLENDRPWEGGHPTDEPERQEMHNEAPTETRADAFDQRKLPEDAARADLLSDSNVTEIESGQSRDHDRDRRSNRDSDRDRRDRRDYDRDRRDRDRSSRERFSRDRDGVSRDRDRDRERDRYERRDRNRDRSSRDRDRSSRDRSSRDKERTSRDRGRSSKDRDRSSRERGRSRDKDRVRERSSRDRDNDRHRNRYGDGERDRFGRNERGFDRYDRERDRSRTDREGNNKDSKDGTENTNSTKKSNPWTMSRWGAAEEPPPSSNSHKIHNIPEEVEIDDDDDDVIMTEEPGSWDAWAQMAGQPSSGPNGATSPGPVDQQNNRAVSGDAPIVDAVITLSGDEEKEAETSSDQAPVQSLDAGKSNNPEEKSREIHNEDFCEPSSDDGRIINDDSIDVVSPSCDTKVDRSAVEAHNEFLENRLEEPCDNIGQNPQAIERHMDEFSINGVNPDPPSEANLAGSNLEASTSGEIEPPSQALERESHDAAPSVNCSYQDKVAEELLIARNPSPEPLDESSHNADRTTENSILDPYSVLADKSSGLVTDVSLDYEYSMTQDTSMAGDSICSRLDEPTESSTNAGQNNERVNGLNSESEHPFVAEESKGHKSEGHAELKAFDGTPNNVIDDQISGNDDDDDDEGGAAGEVLNVRRSARTRR